MNRLRTFAVLSSLVVALAGCSDPEGSGPSVNNDTTGNNGSSNNAEPMEEVCNGEDDDGDGEIDEDFNVGESCTVGDGACADVSVYVCDGLQSTRCDAMNSQPAQELCGDDVDNDCDGEVDEGFPDLGTPCTAGVGACQVSGSVVCDTEDGTQTTCGAEPIMPPEANETSCDGIDNDCDGEVDEGCDDDEDGWCDAEFAALAGGPCTNGEGDCDDENGDVYPGSMIPGCGDGLDNDCNGTVDDYKVISRVTNEFVYNDNINTVENMQPSILADALGNGEGFCAVFVENGGAGIQFLIMEQNSQGNDLIIPGSYFSGANFRLFDIDPYFSGGCAALYGREVSGNFRIGVADFDQGGNSDTNNLADNVYEADVVWPYSMFLDQPYLRIAAMPPNNQGELVEYVAGPTSITVGSFQVGILSQHTFFERYGTNDYLFSGNFFNRFFGITEASYSAISDWGGEFQIDYPDTILLPSGERYVSGFDGTEFGVYELIDNGSYSIGATGTTSTVTDRDWMTRNTFVEGPNNDVFVIDSAADRLYQMVVDGEMISFVEADISALPPGSNLLTGATQEGNLRILSLAGNDPLEFETADLQCF